MLFFKNLAKFFKKKKQGTKKYKKKEKDFEFYNTLKAGHPPHSKIQELKILHGLTMNLHTHDTHEKCDNISNYDHQEEKKTIA